MNNYMPLFYIDVIMYPCPYPEACLSNLNKHEVYVYDYLNPNPHQLQQL